MNKEDRRYRAAYHLLHAHIAAQIALGHLTGGAKTEAERLLGGVEAELNPPEFEEVEVVRWAIVAPSGFVEMTASSEQLASREVAGDGRYSGYQVAKLTGSVMRPIKRPVVKSCPMTLTGVGWIGDGLDIAGEDTFPLKGTFTWQK